MNKLTRQLLIIAALAAITLSHAFAQATASTYTGPDNGNWNDPTNWSPPLVPNNLGPVTFDVTIDNVTINLDVDATISSLTTPGDAPFLFSTDHNLTTGMTDMGGFGDYEFTADTKDVKADLGNLKAFSGTRLNETAFFLAAIAGPGRTATIQFKGANVVTNNGGVGFQGDGTARIVDENGLDAFRNFTHNEPLGFFQVGPGGGHYTIANSVTNEGYLFVGDGGTLTLAQNLTQIGDLRDPDDQQGGFIQEISGDASAPARFILNGVLTNYDGTTKTLHAGRYNLEGTPPGICTIQVLGGALLDIVNNDASVLLAGRGSAILDKDGANALRNLSVSQRLRIVSYDFTTAGPLTVSASEFATLTTRGDSHFTVSGDLKVLGGHLEVSPLGLVAGGHVNNSELKINGDLTIADAAITHFEVFGPKATGVATVAGNAALAGTLEIFVIPKAIVSADGETPEDAPILSGGSLTLLTAQKITGSFSNVASGGRVTAYAITDFNDPLGTFNGVINGSFKATYDNNSLVISDFQPHASMLNISTRLKVETGDNVGIGGFIVRGMGPKKVMVRGIGPSLAGKGVAGALQDPMLELHDSNNATIASNDNWQDTQAGDITKTGIAPSDSHESAIIATLDPGMYTAVMSGVNNTMGVGLIEVYDLDDQPPVSEFANISTRGRVETADSVMIGGIIVGPDHPANLIVRAIGPSLTAKGVAGSLQDPTLELRDASGTLLMSNDNWQDNAAQASLIQGASLAPTDSHESALAVTLDPGNYTAIVRGKNNTQGVAVVEFYKLN